MAASEYNASLLLGVGRWVFGVVQAGSLAHISFSYFLSTSVLQGESMWPTFMNQGDIVFVERLSTKLGLLKPGEQLAI